MNLNNEQQQAERRRLAAAFDGVLTEPIPDRLSALLNEPAAVAAQAPATVVDLAAARAKRPSMNLWTAWGGMAASLVLGTVIGTRLPSDAGDRADSRALARGALAQALDTQLASMPQGDIAVLLSFKAKDGRWCRSFSTSQNAGLACRDADGAWALQVLAAAVPTASGMRQAGTSLPPAVLSAVDAVMAGETLNAEQEKAVRNRGWR